LPVFPHQNNELIFPRQQDIAFHLNSEQLE